MKRRKTSVRERSNTPVVEEAQECKGWSPELERMLRTIQDDEYQTRIIQVYLNTTGFSQTAVEMPMMLANLHLVAMDGFLASSGYKITGVIYPPDGLASASIVPAKTRLLEVSAGRHQSVMEYALLFLNDSQNRPTILSIEANRMTGQVEFTLRVDTRWPTDFFTRWRDYAIEHAYLRGQRFYASGQLIRYESPTQLCDVRLSEQTRAKIDRTILAFPRQAKRFKQRGLPAKRGVLLEGPPGTGKTMLCRALCHEIDATFIWVTSRHVEDDAGAIAAVWQLARWLQPAVVLLEDVDLYSLSREQTLRPHIVGELMNQMDGVESSDGILTLATTNRVDVIETALCDRPGRFDRIIHIGELGSSDRRALVTQYLSADLFEGDALDQLVEQSDGYTGAKVIDLVKTLLDLGTLDENGQDCDGGADEADLHITLEVVERALRQAGGKRRRRRIGFVS